MPQTRPTETTGASARAKVGISTAREEVELVLKTAHRERAREIERQQAGVSTLDTYELLLFVAANGDARLGVHVLYRR